MINPFGIRCVAFLFATYCLVCCHCFAEEATITVAASDSSEVAKSAADFCCTGVDDQLTIQQAISALPPAGGTVQLLAGNFDIRKVPKTLGGIVIDRSYVTLAGQGLATRLKLAAGQNTNVIRIIGSGVGHVTIRDLAVDANRLENDQGTGDTNLSHDRFEFCGIKAFRQAPSGPLAKEDCHDITIRNCQVKDAHRLGIMLEGPAMRVLDNFLGDAGSDVVEILTGPGIIRGNMIDTSEGSTRIKIGGGQTTLTGNVLDNVTIEIDDATGAGLPVLLGINSLHNSPLDLTQGLLKLFPSSSETP
ncbi:MAG: hypothetical protein KDA72_03660 [Planctomycetales bacterium]|nr:hypothetical protein [Planctomycetales bacterium]